MFLRLFTDDFSSIHGWSSLMYHCFSSLATFTQLFSFAYDEREEQQSNQQCIKAHVHACACMWTTESLPIKYYRLCIAFMVYSLRSDCSFYFSQPHPSTTKHSHVARLILLANQLCRFFDFFYHQTLVCAVITWVEVCKAGALNFSSEIFSHRCANYKWDVYNLPKVNTFGIILKSDVSTITNYPKSKLQENLRTFYYWIYSITN